VCAKAIINKTKEVSAVLIAIGLIASFVWGTFGEPRVKAIHKKENESLEITVRDISKKLNTLLYLQTKDMPSSEYEEAERKAERFNK